MSYCPARTGVVYALSTAPFVEPAGFKLEKVVDVGPYHYGAVFTKTSNDRADGVGA